MDAVFAAVRIGADKAARVKPRRLYAEVVQDCAVYAA
jgi:hypothetical protein